jgi:hypothetical protein
MSAPHAGGLAAAAFLAVALLATPPSRAADLVVDAGVRVAAPACPIAPLSVPAFVDSLRVELAGRPRPPGTTRVGLAVEPCDTATSRVHVAVTNDAGAPAVERDVGLEDIALGARPRALALAVAELVRGEEVALAPAPPAVVAAPPPPPRAASTLVPGVAGDALVALYPSRGTTLWGGRLSASLARGRWGLELFGEAAAGEHGYADGDVALQSFGGGAAAGPRWVRGRFTLAPALVGSVAWARIQGEAAASDVHAGSGDDFTVAVRVRAAASAVFVRVLSVRAFVEGGYMARGFDSRVDGARAAGMSGASLVAGLGLGL